MGFATLARLELFMGQTRILQARYALEAINKFVTQPDLSTNLLVTMIYDEARCPSEATGCPR
jgi:hypothetical protein